MATSTSCSQKAFLCNRRIRNLLGSWLTKAFCADNIEHRSSHLISMQQATHVLNGNREFTHVRRWCQDDRYQYNHINPIAQTKWIIRRPAGVLDVVQALLTMAKCIFSRLIFSQSLSWTGHLTCINILNFCCLQGWIYWGVHTPLALARGGGGAIFYDKAKKTKWDTVIWVITW
jgi:hypothetical protein